MSSTSLFAHKPTHTPSATIKSNALPNDEIRSYSSPMPLYFLTTIIDQLERNKNYVDPLFYCFTASIYLQLERYNDAEIAAKKAIEQTTNGIIIRSAYNIFKMAKIKRN